MPDELNPYLQRTTKVNQDTNCESDKNQLYLIINFIQYYDMYERKVQRNEERLREVWEIELGWPYHIRHEASLRERFARCSLAPPSRQGLQDVAENRSGTPGTLSEFQEPANLVQRRQDIQLASWRPPEEFPKRS